MKMTNTLRNILFLSLLTTFLFPSFTNAQCTTPDTTKPIARCKNATVYLDANGDAGLDPRQVDGGSRDNCSTWYLILNHPCFYCSDVGNKNLTLYVQDRAGNTSSCTAVVTVRDTTRPTLVLRRDMVVTLLQPTATVNANLFVSSVTDNCSALNKIQLGVRKVGTGLGFPNANTITFTCKDTGLVNLELWARDSSGNAETKTITINVKSNAGVCPTIVITPTTPMIMGGIRTEGGKAIAANVSLNGGNTPSPITVKASDFKFDNLTRGSNYTLTPARDTDVLNGITTFDIALMSRHALDIEPFTSPYKLIAGDVNKDGTIDAIDMVTTRKLVLRQIPRFPSNTAWRFIPKNHTFPALMDDVPMTFPEALSVNNITDTLRGADFMAVKIGDINSSASNLTTDMPVLVRGNKQWQLSTEDKNLEKGQVHYVDIAADNLSINAFQFTLNYDKKALQIMDIQTLSLQGFETANYALFEEKGMITISWNSVNAIAEGQPKLFRIVLQAMQHSPLSNALFLTSDLTPAEAYTPNGDNYGVQLQFKGKNTEGSLFTLLPNAPNPFNTETTIRFRLPKDEAVKLTVYDETGRIVKSLNNSFPKGYNEMSLDMREIAVSGVYYYRLETANNAAMQRMVILK
jgi:hypothetical protein